MRTPGPWYAYPNGSEARPYMVGGKDRLMVADCWTLDRPREERASNARAIAALPGLIEAAKLAVLDIRAAGLDCGRALEALVSALRDAGEEA